MTIRRMFVFVALLAMTIGFSCLEAAAQGRRGFGGVGRLALAQVDEVQTELQMNDEQVDEVAELRESLGARGRGRGFQDQTDPDRQKQAAERASKERAALADVLESPQLERLDQIFVQAAGARALTDPHVVAALELDSEQQQTIQDAIADGSDEMRSVMQDLFQSNDGDFESMREKMAEVREQFNEDVLASLPEDVQRNFTQLKGAAFDLPASALRGGARGRGGRGGFGGGGGGRGRGNRGDRGDRPQRPQRPEN